MGAAADLLAKAIAAKAAEELARLALPDDLTEDEAKHLADWAFLGGLRGAVDRLRAPDVGDHVRFKDTKGVERIGLVYGFTDSLAEAQVVTPPGPRTKRSYEDWLVDIRTIAKVDIGEPLATAVAAAERARRDAYRRANAR